METEPFVGGMTSALYPVLYSINPAQKFLRFPEAEIIYQTHRAASDKAKMITLFGFHIITRYYNTMKAVKHSLELKNFSKCPEWESDLIGEVNNLR